MKLPRFLWKHLTIWGAELESNLPPEFYITLHAQKRLTERVGVKPEKMRRLVAKAWYSKDVPIPKLRITQNKNEYFNSDKSRVARELMGKIYIFAYSRYRGPFAVQKVLVTVI